jgi:NAD(P)-dependent dehydrogenase (short-subunit alcohol dehydrogenase family)
MRGAQGKNREAAEALRKLGIKTVELDVSDDASVEAGVKKVLAEAGTIDVLVNNAGIGSAGVTEAFTAEQAKVVFDTNVIGLLRVTRAVLPSMRREARWPDHQHRLGPRPRDVPLLGIYGASKFAVEALTDSLRYEVSQLGVEVVEVQPSAYPTNFFTGIQTPADTEVTKSYGEVGQIPDAMFKSFTSRFEGKDAPNPHDVAEAIATLVGQSKGSRAARTVVGAAFGADKANEDVAPVQAQAVEALGSATSKKSPDALGGNSYGRKRLVSCGHDHHDRRARSTECQLRGRRRVRRRPVPDQPDAARHRVCRLARRPRPHT